GQHVWQQVEVVDERRDERFHALCVMAVGNLGEDLRGGGRLRGEGGCAAARLGSEQKFAAWRRPQHGNRLEGTLVSDGERAKGVNLVAEELDADRMGVRGGKDVDN